MASQPFEGYSLLENILDFENMFSDNDLLM